MNNPILPKQSPFTRPAPLSALITLARKAAGFAAQKRAEAKARAKTRATERLKAHVKSGGINSFVLLSQYMDEVNGGPIYRAKNRERRLNSLVQSKR